jgi:hypothetical protein
MDLNMAKKTSVTYRNPVAKAMLQERKSPQVVPPKKGSKAKHNRRKDNLNAIRDAKLYQDD